MSRPTPRRPASSRGATPRPRKIAGQAPAPRPDGSETTEADTPADGPDPAKGRSRDSLTVGRSGPARAAVPEAGDDGPDAPAILASPTVTRVLVGVLGALTLLLVVQGVLWTVSDDDPVRVVARDPGRVTVPEDRPVVAGEVAVLEGVDAAAKAAQRIVAVNYENYDEEVEAAAELMTADFEEEYRTTKSDIKDRIVRQQTVVQAGVVAQGVVRANRTELEALIFLNQVVERVRDKEPETVVTPYKVLVTMVHTDQGWLVDDLDTDEAAEGGAEDGPEDGAEDGADGGAEDSGE